MNKTEQKEQPETNKNTVNNKTTKQKTIQPQSTINRSPNKKIDNEIIVNNEQKQVTKMLGKSFGNISTSQSPINVNSTPQVSAKSVDINKSSLDELKNKLYETTKQIGDELLKQNYKTEDVERITKTMQDECRGSFINSSKRKSATIGL